jgi:hypothetical protein
MLEHFILEVVQNKRRMGLNKSFESSNTQFAELEGQGHGIFMEEPRPLCLESIFLTVCEHGPLMIIPSLFTCDSQRLII